MSMHAVSPSKLSANMLRCMQANLVPMVRSSPGMGKSDIINALARDNNLFVYDFRLAQADITDLNGLPFRTADGRAEFLPFKNFPLEGDELPLHADGTEYDGWLLFFDELSSASKQLQAAAYKILLERMVGHHKLHERVLMCAAGNLATDKAVAHDMSTALQSRLVHLELRVDHREWMAWAAKAGVDSRILGFLEFKPEYLHNFTPDHSDHTYACPRTWWFTHKLINGVQTVRTDDLALIAGTIGPGVAMEFLTFAEIYAELPKLSEIVASPTTAAVPNEPSARFAMSTHLADLVDASNVDPLLKYLGRYPVEFRVVALRLMKERHPSLTRHASVMAMWQDLVTYL